MVLTKLLDRIQQEQSGYSPSQKRVAAYVLENYKQIPFNSITTLSDRIGVSQYSVITFCKNLGYNKFSEFKKEFSQYAADLIIYNKLSQKEQNEDIDHDPNDYFDQALTEDCAAIEATLRNRHNRESMSRFVEMLNSARYIYVIGGRASSHFAALLASCLRYLDLKVIDLMPDRGDFLDRISMITPKDMVVAISFPRYTAQIVDGLVQIRGAGVPIALITDNHLSPAQSYADLTFYCEVKSTSYVQCYAGCLSLISAICRAASDNCKKKSAQHVHDLEEQLYQQGVFATGNRSSKQQ